MRTWTGGIKWLVLAASVLLSAGIAAAQTVSVDVGSGSTSTAGGNVAITVSLTAGGQTVVGSQNDIIFDSAFANITGTGRCIINRNISSKNSACNACSGGSKDGQDCSTDADCPDDGSCQPKPKESLPTDAPCKDLNAALATCPASGCETGFDGQKRFRGIILSLSNTQGIPDGPLYTCTFAVAAGEPGTTVLTNKNITVSGTSGALPSTGANGSIERVAAPTDTPTPTATNTLAASPTPTKTNTAPPTATRTNTVPPTATNTVLPASDDDSGCQIAAGHHSGSTWLLFIPAAALLWLRRRSR